MATHPVRAYSITEHDSSPSNLRYPAWQREYEALLLEANPAELLKLVHKAEAAIFNRLQALARPPEMTDHKAEEQAIAEALRTVRVLKRDKLQFPDWQAE